MAAKTTKTKKKTTKKNKKTAKKPVAKKGKKSVKRGGAKPVKKTVEKPSQKRVKKGKKKGKSRKGILITALVLVILLVVGITYVLTNLDILVKMAIEKYGLIQGLKKGFWRITRCHPFNKGGVDLP